MSDSWGTGSKTLDRTNGSTKRRFGSMCLPRTSFLRVNRCSRKSTESSGWAERTVRFRPSCGPDGGFLHDGNEPGQVIRDDPFRSAGSDGRNVVSPYRNCVCESSLEVGIDSGRCDRPKFEAGEESAGAATRDLLGSKLLPRLPRRVKMVAGHVAVVGRDKTRSSGVVSSSFAHAAHRSDR